MYVSTNILIHALKDLAFLHPFYGITYLVCKKHGLPISSTQEFPINSAETAFLEEHYKPIRETEKFFRVFRSSDKQKYWLNNDYASSGSQATRTQMFAEAFIHSKNSSSWGWTRDYIGVLERHLNSKKIPAYSLAFWMLKDRLWQDAPSADDILKTFWKEYSISKPEIRVLFDTEEPNWLNGEGIVTKSKYDWGRISSELKIPPPADLPVEKDGALVSLGVRNIEPYKDFSLKLSSRLNIITGDNGLGKSFILECAWWMLTGHWTNFAIYPKSENPKHKPALLFELSGKAGRTESFKAEYSWKTQSWIFDKKNRKTIPGLAIYAQVDGAFSIWDPARISSEDYTNGASRAILNFTRDDVWNGLRIDEGNRSRSIFNGLITDWVHWQNSNSKSFEVLRKVLKRLSPPDRPHADLGVLEPGTIGRIPGDSRPMPTIKHSYGETFLVYASAAVKRIVAFAYLIVWTWEEHQTAAQLARENVQSKMVIIADEIESHLHPQWQRIILPALTLIARDLNDSLDIQFIGSTHSPLVMASIEPLFDEDTDSIFHLNLEQEKGANSTVIVETPEFEKRGSADSWLTSNVFDLGQPRSIEAEEAIEEAKNLQKQKAPSKDAIINTSKKLLDLLAPHDTFWIRWNYFAEKHGVELS